ncbi:hypothetical protein C8R48DRAFT_245273 [Suillus tomentosus]|nr:hypothetical protein C8R48DRAFT_245273 [Suillus tomentosus]
MHINSKENDNLSPASQIISALHIILRSQAVVCLCGCTVSEVLLTIYQMPDVETPYSQTTSPNSNHCAIELNDQSISAIITHRQQQLDATLHDISSLETVIDKINNLHRQLTEQKEKLISSITLHKRLISPIWHLPTEVLSHIFVHCLPEDKYLSPASKLAPVLLTRICRRWREVAVGTPSLWDRLDVPYDVKRQRELPFCLDVWLKRSRGRLLSLALTCCFSSTLIELRRLLQPYINQISSFSICCRVISHKFDPLFEGLIALQELIVNKPLTEQCFSLLPPTLRSFKVTASHSELKFFPSCEPVWANLTNVEIPMHRPDTILRLLQLCPNLRSLAIRLGFDRTEIFQPLVHVRIQSLHIIVNGIQYSHRLLDDIDDSTPNPLPGLLNTLSLPSLRTLEIHGVPWPHQEFKSFLTRSNCPLETVILGAEAMMGHKQRAECIALIPSLEVVVSQSEEF